MESSVTFGQPELEKRYNRNRTTLWRWRNNPKTGFPAPDMILNGRPRWYESTIRAFERASTKRTAA